MKRIVVMISGTGTNLQALIDAERLGDLAAKIVLVVSNRKAALGLQRAKKAQIPTLYFPFGSYKENANPREAYDQDLAKRIQSFEPDLIVLAGWMRILSNAFLSSFPEQVLNLHPAMPGQFAGTHAIERALLAFQKEEISYTGVMVHWVVPKIDAGPVILSERVPIYARDTLTQLEERVHKVEHKLIVQAVQRVLAK